MISVHSKKIFYSRIAKRHVNELDFRSCALHSGECVVSSSHLEDTLLIVQISLKCILLSCYNWL